MWRSKLFFEVVLSIVEAYVILLNSKSKIRLPDVRGSVVLSTAQIQKRVSFTDSLLKFLIFTRKHNCFYRSFVRMKVLRKRNVPVKLNIGLRNFDTDIHTRGHCWLTLEDQLFFEPIPSDSHLLPNELYPFLLGSYKDVSYWFNGKDGDTLLRFSS